MRHLSVLAVLLSVGVGVFAAANGNPYLRLEQKSKNGTIHVIGKNTSDGPIVAYVVVFERGNKRVVWHGAYSGADSLATGKTVEVGDVPADSSKIPPTLFVDYVRLANGTTWGDVTSDEAKEIAARFQK